MPLSNSVVPGTAGDRRLSNDHQCKSFSVLLDQFRDQRGPAGLMAGADARAIVAVEVFVKRDEIPPVRIVLKFLRTAENRPAAVFVAEKNPRESLGNFACDLPQIEHFAGACRAFDFVAVAKEVMKLLQRFNEQKIHREPDRPAPIGVAAEQSGARLRRLVIDAVFRAVAPELVGMSR